MCRQTEDSGHSNHPYPLKRRIWLNMKNTPCIFTFPLCLFLSYMGTLFSASYVESRFRIVGYFRLGFQATSYSKWSFPSSSNSTSKMKNHTSIWSFFSADYLTHVHWYIDLSGCHIIRNTKIIFIHIFLEEVACLSLWLRPCHE